MRVVSCDDESVFVIIAISGSCTGVKRQAFKVTQMRLVAESTQNDLPFLTVASHSIKFRVFY